jgi:hypothetical protein
MAQINDNRLVAGWTVEQFKNGALSALLPLITKKLVSIRMAAFEKVEWKSRIRVNGSKGPGMSVTS